MLEVFCKDLVQDHGHPDAVKVFLFIASLLASFGVCVCVSGLYSIEW